MIHLFAHLYDEKQTFTHDQLMLQHHRESWSSSQLKEALQRDAYDAVLGQGGEWSLVSVDGHQDDEEEL
jgi:hypothetical protein